MGWGTARVLRDRNARFYLGGLGDVAGSRDLGQDPHRIRQSRRVRRLLHLAADLRRTCSPKFRAEKKLKKAQQALARKVKGSRNRRKARLKVARTHAKVADARRDFHHKLSTTLVQENQLIVVEDLAVGALGRTRMAKSVHDAGWSTFVSMLEYKAARCGRTLVRVDRMFPSSRVCSACGFRDGPKPLHVRTWTCTGCDTTHDRDINAARNIRAQGKRMVAAGQAETLNGYGAQVRPGAIPAQRGEAATHLDDLPPQASARAGDAGGIPGL